MDEHRFWEIIDKAWQDVDKKGTIRAKLMKGIPSDSLIDECFEKLEDVIAEIEKQLDKLSAEDLLQFDRILERKLYDIDREDVHEHTEGSDDGFLYARGFIVAIGKQYYEAVNATPALAGSDLDCEEMCFLPRSVYEGKYGEMPLSEISRESCSNKAGWPNLQ